MGKRCTYIAYNRFGTISRITVLDNRIRVVVDGKKKKKKVDRAMMNEGSALLCLFFYNV